MHREFNVETRNGENHENRESTIQSEKYTREDRITTLFRQSVSNLAGLLASKLAQRWRRSHSLPLSLTLYVHYNKIIPTSTTLLCSAHMMFCPRSIYILIHNIGLFTNIALSGTLTLFADVVLSRLLIRLLSKSTWI